MVLLKDLLNQEDNNSSLTFKQDDQELGVSHLPSPAFTHSTVNSSNSDNDLDDDDSFDTKIQKNLPSPTNTITNATGINQTAIDAKTAADSLTSANMTPPSIPTPTLSTNSTSPSSPAAKELSCQWAECSHLFSQPEFLYHHLCHDHVGRKSQRNLQLNCQWGNCKVKTEKRDHITSHLRVHVPLTPFSCKTCTKKFKRPQDLKKHLKIHVADDSQVRIKKKRGPKSKADKERLLQLSLQDSTIANSGSNNQNCQNSQFYNNDLQNMIPKELFSQCDPSYSQHVISRLQTVLPPLSHENNLNVNNNLYHPQPYHQLPASSSTVSKAMFFSNLSRDLNTPVRPPVVHQNVSYVYQGQTPVQQTQVHYAQLQSNTNNIQQIGHDSQNKYPELPHLSSSLYNSTTSYPQQYPQQQQQQQQQYPQQHQQQHTSVLPPLNQSPQMFTPRYESLQRLPHFNVQSSYFSTVQKSNGKDMDALAEDVFKLSIDKQENNNEEEDEEEEFVDVLNTVEIIKDYLICSLLEEEYESDEEFDDDKLVNQLKSDTPVTLKKYPKILV
ncbi:hypothetical protein Kpol_388p8 [Vanderwaltozyma polyspora DSM 70294]|uniref:C2H2-type domain-containing protein n=1 Tax=Vanderwaltozyma polyspora (strain ATCC 22028 / DSM 70294 / BCRC 21397 / CBS 2163 / NBRC 10782 / NRRL Y-8283 / UCD 57-17) TaxID=436907 RepID=A7TRZ6_VANPO|nr:uncharacterized protein Kpol_388p8 [Vanderwaltozyma polyspora DSM 70294]EDO14964.1 hypothetical protein Kpol_388p8 [Vanderwaltozyma polyspora DSM 70294]